MSRKVQFKPLWMNCVTKMKIFKLEYNGYNNKKVTNKLYN